LKGRSSVASTMKASMDALVTIAKEHSGNMQKTAAALQESFGAVGDSGAAGLMQTAKQSAGTLVHKAEDADAVAKKLGSLVKDAPASGFTDPATVSKAERTMENIDETVAAGEAVEDALEKLVALASPSPTHTNASKQYYPVMYFVDKQYDGVPSTCSGDAVAEPIVDESQDGCASACDAHIHSCVGFQYFDNGSNKLCFLFSKFSEGFYYTGCGKKPSVESTCFAKLSKFEGTTLKPDGSGKCKQCFKKLTKADRCYSSAPASPPSAPPAPPPPAPKQPEKKAPPAPAPPAPTKKKDSDLIDDNDFGGDDYGDDYGGDDYDGGLDLHGRKAHHHHKKHL